MNGPASAPRVSGNPVRDLPLPDPAGFTHRWVDAGRVRLHAVEGGQPEVRLSCCSPGSHRPGRHGAR